MPPATATISGRFHQLNPDRLSGFTGAAERERHSSKGLIESPYNSPLRKPSGTFGKSVGVGLNRNVDVRSSPLRVVNNSHPMTLVSTQAYNSPRGTPTRSIKTSHIRPNMADNISTASVFDQQEELNCTLYVTYIYIFVFIKRQDNIYVYSNWIMHI